MFTNDLVKNRIAKRNLLLEKGENPFPSMTNIRKETLNVESFINTYGDQINVNGTRLDTVTEIVFGKIKLIRKMGKSGFLNIESEGFSLQGFCSINAMNENFDIFKSCLDLGDIVSLTGNPYLTNTGELTIYVTEIKVLTKSLTPPPEKFNGLQDIETKYKQRYLDMLNDSSVVEKFKMRSFILKTVRTTLEGLDFLEVETPMLNSIPGGANARPFITHHNALGVDKYLRIAPELYLKKLLVGGLPAVFEIGKNFRNEGVDNTHNPEFTAVEFYKSFIDYKELMILVKGIIRNSVAASHYRNWNIPYLDYTINFNDWKEISFKDSLIEIGNIPEEILDSTEKMIDFLKEKAIKVNPDLSKGKLWEELFDNFVEEKLINPTFIMDYPIEISPLARRNDSNPELAERFELFIAGKEIANGFNELNDPQDQYERFLNQVKNKDSDDESMFMDTDYVEALMNGLPPCAGAGIGLDRLVMLLTNSKSIKEIIIFPAMKN